VPARLPLGKEPAQKDKVALISMRERTLGDVIVFFSQAVSMPPTEKDYRTLDISLFDWGGRRRFAEIFRVTMICLVYRALPAAFPQYADQLREILENVFTRTYENDRVAGTASDVAVKESDKVVDEGAKRPGRKFRNFFKQAKGVPGKSVPEAVAEFDALIDMNARHPFMKMAVRAAGIFQRFKANAMSAEKLNARLELLYAHFSTLGNDVLIVQKPTKDVLKEADRILKQKNKTKAD